MKCCILIIEIESQSMARKVGRFWVKSKLLIAGLHRGSVCIKSIPCLGVLSIVLLDELKEGPVASLLHHSHQI